MGSGFLNKPATASTGLTTVGARTYDPVLGKFLSVDPITAPENPAQNLGYAYSGNNPITFNDPSGLCYNAATDSMTMNANCADGHGASMPDAYTVKKGAATKAKTQPKAVPQRTYAHSGCGQSDFVCRSKAALRGTRRRWQ